MFTKKTLLSDALFAGQVGGLVIYGVTQANKMRTSVQGVSMSMFILFSAFVVYLLVLSIRSHRAQPSRLTFQIMTGHIIGTLMVGTFTIMLMKYLFDGTYQWVANDTITMWISLLGCLLILVVSKAKGLDLSSPTVRGYLASCCKALPQAFMAWKMWHTGGAGFAAFAIWIAHVTTFIRLVQVWLSMREASKESNRLGMFIPEVTNELTWIMVTFAWLYGG
ncbi:MAG: hypothetical protein NTX72_00690 [Candidatus Uhrbacteria bacterium]|nr:hypothetical protein [Candidatus Uhrbacteria bacterium]